MEKPKGSPKVKVGPWLLLAQPAAPPGNYTRYVLVVDEVEVLVTISVPSPENCVGGLRKAYQAKLIDKKHYRHQLDRYKAWKASHPAAPLPRKRPRYSWRPKRGTWPPAPPKKPRPRVRIQSKRPRLKRVWIAQFQPIPKKEKL